MFRSQAGATGPAKDGSFSGLSGRLGGIFGKFKQFGGLSRAEIDDAVKEIRSALLEADVALPVARSFCDRVRERAVQEYSHEDGPASAAVVRIVHEEIVSLLTPKEETAEAKENETQFRSLFQRQSDDKLPGSSSSSAVPDCVLMVGIQGSGKTTTTVKLAYALKNAGRRVFVASTDTSRPAAREQLARLADAVGITSMSYGDVDTTSAEALAQAAMQQASAGNFDLVLLDSAGRLDVDELLMNELVAIRNDVRPLQTFLVADAMTGNEAVAIAKTFHEHVGVTGVILSRSDADTRGGAALSMVEAIDRPIRFLGVGEQAGDLRPFEPAQAANRILGHGEILKLAERAQEGLSEEEQQRLLDRVQTNKFSLNEYLIHLRQTTKLGGITGILQSLPGMNHLASRFSGDRAEQEQGTASLALQERIISAMHDAERENPKLLDGDRRAAIATAAGVTVQDVNGVLKQFDALKTAYQRWQKLKSAEDARARKREKRKPRQKPKRKR